MPALRALENPQVKCGSDLSKAEVLNVSPLGFWLFVAGMAAIKRLLINTRLQPGEFEQEGQNRFNGFMCAANR
jgi:hypothetical protein